MNMVEVLQKTLMVTAFVAVIMLVMEYLNVQTRGVLLRALEGSPWRQYLLAAALGAIPGCLGAYAVVAMYAHRKLTFGALVATMIATSGDEIFVMLVLFPTTALLMTVGLAALGAVAGWATDRLVPARALPTDETCCSFDTHDLDECRCYPRGAILAQWRPPSPYRATLVVGLALVALAAMTSVLGPPTWGWKRVTLLVTMGTGLFVAATVPEHFLEEHLWRHVVQRHVPRIFLWTLGVLTVLTALDRFTAVGSLVAESHWGVLVLAALVGVIPESGPHLAIVTMYADGLVPLSVLVANSIVQDGHGMLPLLAASKRAFVLVKLLNLVVGVVVGAALLAAGR